MTPADKKVVSLSPYLRNRTRTLVEVIAENRVLRAGLEQVALTGADEETRQWAAATLAAADEKAAREKE